jgi:type I restriction enzyme S subunit
MSRSSGWLETPLGHVTEEVRKRYGKGSVEYCIPMYGVERGSGLTSETKYASKDTSKYKVVEPGMFVYNPMRLNIGSIGMVEKHRGIGLVSPDYVVFRCIADKLMPEYLDLFTRSKEWQAWVDAAGVGSVRTRIYYRELAEMPLMLPRIDEQRRICKIFGAIQEKSSTNAEIRDSVSQIAESIFVSWFVDFDPVHAKAEGKKPFGMDDDTAALFPDSFEDSELGEIPRGWEVVALPDVLDVDPKRAITRGSDAPYLDMKNMPTTGHRPGGWIRKPFHSGSRFINGDTLVARITPCLENGKTAYVDFLKGNEVGWGSTEFIVMRPKPPLPTEYGYLFARSERFRAYAIQSMTGSSGRQRVAVNSLDDYLVVKPTDDVTNKFGAVVRPIMELIKVNSEQSMTLGEIRADLLPNLLSGEIRIPADQVKKTCSGKVGAR